MEKYKAEVGKVFISKIDGAILSNTLILGKDDSIENYDQVDESILIVEDDENVE